MNTAKLKKFEIAGVLIIYAAASLLHFLYRLTDGNIFAILFGAVNESVWENIKNFPVYIGENNKYVVDTDILIENVIDLR